MPFTVISNLILEGGIDPQTGTLWLNSHLVGEYLKMSAVEVDDHHDNVTAFNGLTDTPNKELRTRWGLIYNTRFQTISGYQRLYSSGCLIEYVKIFNPGMTDTILKLRKAENRYRDALNRYNN